MSINDYFIASIEATHTGFCVTLARVNNITSPGSLFVGYSSSSPILSTQLITQTLNEAIDSIDESSDYLKTEKVVTVLTNENRSLQTAIFNHLGRKKYIQSYTSPNIGISLFTLADSINSWKLTVKSDLVRDIQMDLQNTTDTDVSHQILSLLALSDTFSKGCYRNLGLPSKGQMFMRC